MKLETNTVEVTTNAVYDETFKVTIADDDEAVSMVIERLIEAYKNPYRAALREYTSNAYDEHVQSGVTRPVEVSLPTGLSPVLKVQDFGRGLTRDELKGFGTIGKSTKRDSNDTTGGFGMGSKCALAAAPTFTVVSVKDGVRNTVIVARDANNIPHMNFLAEQKTTDESGTTVVIPISDPEKFGDLKDFWVGWKPGSILVDDEEPKRTVFDADKFRTMRAGIAWYDLSNATGAGNMIRVLINQVYYELDYRDLGLEYKQWNILKYYIIKLDNGTVKIAPSREGLIFNATTKAAVKKRMDAVLSFTAREQAKLVTDAPDIKTALTLRERMRNNGFPVEGIKWNGKGFALPGHTVHGNLIPDQIGTWVMPARSYDGKTGWRCDKTWGAISNKNVWTNREDHKFVIVHGAGEASSYGKSRYRKAHREAHGVGEYLSTISDARQFTWSFFVTSEPLKSVNRHYRDMAQVIMTADEFNAVVKGVRAEAARLVKDARDAKKANRKLNVMSPGYYSTDEMTVQEVADSFDHVVFLRNQDGGYGDRFRQSLMTKVNNNRTWNETFNILRRQYKVAVILIGKNDKIADIKPLLPPAMTFQELAVKAIRETYQTATTYDLMAIRDRQDEGVGVFRALHDDHLAKIKNKETVKWAKSVRDFKDEGANARAKFEWMTHYDQGVREALAAGRLDTSKALPKSPMERYPLLRSVSTYNVRPADVVDYINLREKALSKKG